jgi:hypothetical protein
MKLEVKGDHRDGTLVATTTSHFEKLLGRLAVLQVEKEVAQQVGSNGSGQKLASWKFLLVIVF